MLLSVYQAGSDAQNMRIQQGTPFVKRQNVLPNIGPALKEITNNGCELFVQSKCKHQK